MDVQILDEMMQKYTSIRENISSSYESILEAEKNMKSKLNTENNTSTDKCEQLANEYKLLTNSLVYSNETLRSIARQQIVHIENIINQLNIIANICKDANGQLLDKHTQSIDYAQGSITKSLNEIHRIGINLNDLININQTTIHQQRNLINSKVEYFSSIKHAVSNYLNKHVYFSTIAVSVIGAILAGATHISFVLGEYLLEGSNDVKRLAQSVNSANIGTTSEIAGFICGFVTIGSIKIYNFFTSKDSNSGRINGNIELENLDTISNDVKKLQNDIQIYLNSIFNDEFSKNINEFLNEKDATSKAVEKCKNLKHFLENVKDSELNKNE